MQIPDDVIINIFSKALPLNTCILAALRTANKQWKRVIEDPLIYEAHFAQLEKYATQNLDQCRIYALSELNTSFCCFLDEDVGPAFVDAEGVLHSCYGLLLCKHIDGDDHENMHDLYVVNPAWGSFWELPSLNDFRSSDLNWKDCKVPGIGFDPSTMALKVVYFWNRRALIHTVGSSSSSWKVLDVELPEIYERQAPVYLKGSLYWLSANGVVVSIDLHEEKLKLYETPISYHGADNVVILVWKGSIAISSMNAYIIFTLNDHEWVKDEFKVDLLHDLLEHQHMEPRERSATTPVASLRNGEIILFASGEDGCYAYYDLKNGDVLKHFDDRFFLRRCTKHFCYMETPTMQV